MLRKLTCAFALLTLSLGAAACDDSEESTGDSTSATDTSTAADTSTTDPGDTATATGEDTTTSTATDATATTDPDTTTTTDPDTTTTTTDPDATTTDPDATTTDPDATTTDPDATTTDPDATTTADTADTMDPDMMMGACDRTGYTAVAEDFVPFSGSRVYIAQDTLSAPVDSLNIEFIEPNGATTTGSYTITDDGYESCDNCVIMYAGCDGNLSNCATYYLANQGTLEITEFGAAGGTFAGTLTDVRMIEVDIDFDNGFVSTPVVDGEVWCLPSYSFSADVQ